MMNMRRVVMAFGIVASCAVAAGAQTPAAPGGGGQAPAGGGQGGGGQRGGGAPQPPPANLQVLPKDIPRAQLTEIMRSFNTALGVQCAHCHVYVAPGDPTNDMAADTKPTKVLARVMIQMTNDVN